MTLLGHAPNVQAPMIKINEIFFSIQGESSLVGWPTVFVRTSGCNLRCTYCDTKYSYVEGAKQDLDPLIQKIRSYPTNHVCITGGEPLLQKNVLPLMTKLCDMGCTVSLETSGSLSCKDVDARVKKIIDVKTPDSGEPDSFLMENLKFSSADDEFKFVICSERDFDWAENFVQTHRLTDRHMVYYSPSFEQTTPQWIAERMLSAGTKARLQLQLHKYIWSPNSRGV